MATTYKIGEAASLLNLKTYVLRFWETEFPHIVPLRTDKGQRLYTEENIALLERIRFLLHERGMTIEGARRILDEDREKGVTYVFSPEPFAPEALPEILKAGRTAGGASGTPPDRAAHPDGHPAPYSDGQDGESPAAGARSTNALSAAGQAVQLFMARYNPPEGGGIRPASDISASDIPVFDQPDCLCESDPPPARPALLRDLAAELELIAALLRQTK